MDWETECLPQMHKVLGLVPNTAKAKRVKRLLWWAYCPSCLAPEAEASPTIRYQPRKCPRLNLLNKNIKHPSSIMMSLTELEETLAVCSEPPPLSRGATTKSRRIPRAQSCSGLEDSLLGLGQATSVLPHLQIQTQICFVALA